MKRWIQGEGKEIDDPAVDAFLRDIVGLCKRHGFALGHEDEHGGFLVRKALDPDWDAWIMNAAICK